MGKCGRGGGPPREVEEEASRNARYCVHTGNASVYT